MKKHLLPLVALALSAPLYAAVELPAFTYSEDFSGSLPEGASLPEGWVCSGVAQPVSDQFAPYFGTEADYPAYKAFVIEGTSAAWSCSTFRYVSAADEWLISPPIRIQSDAEILQLNAVSSGAFASNKYRVLVSENGQDKDSFRPSPLLNTTLTGWETEVRSKQSYSALKGDAGKEICFAFVNRSQDAGLLGFTDIAVAPYILEAEDLTPSVLPAGTSLAIQMNVSLRTPQDIPGLKAVLEYDGKRVEKYFEQKIGINGTRINVSFEDVVVPAGGMEYSVTLTPDFEGAQPTVVTGEIGTPVTDYPAVAFIEEFTGTWCTYCPRGAAFMDYYTDHYNGQDGRIRAFGVAIHVINDPMMMTDESYMNEAYNAAGITGYPSAFFNRIKKGDPSDEYIVEEIAATRSNSRIHINRVDYTPGGDMSVSYEVENSYSKNNMNQRVAFIMIENDVRGDNSDYNQTNGLSGVSETSVSLTYGAALWPYFKFFSEHRSPISYREMSYNHVARGIWPGYRGELLTEPCQAQVPVAGRMAIDMPAQVNIPENTAVIALLLDADTGYVIGADEVHAADYNKNISGVAEVDAARPSLLFEGTMLTTDLPSAGMVEVYGVDGVLTLRKNIPAGACRTDLGDLKGLKIIRVTDGEGNISVARQLF